MIIAIIQARLASTRLPNKVLMEVVPGISMLEMVVRKVQLSKHVEQFGAITTLDERIASFERAWGIPIWCWRPVEQGDYRDPLKEFFWAAVKSQYHWTCRDSNKRDVIVRITADCPLIRPEIIDKCVQEFLDRDVDLVYNSFEDTGADGSDVEVFSMSALEKANNYADEREHPTVWMREHLRTHYVETPFTGCSVDTMEDLREVRRIFREGELR